MMTAEFFLRVSLFTVLVVATCGFPQKGSQSTGQGRSGAAANYASYRGGVPSFAAAPSGAVEGAYGYTSVPTYVQGSGYPSVVAVPGGSGSGYQLEGGVQAAGVSPVAQLGQATTSFSSQPGVAYVVPQMYVPVGDNAGTQDGQPETTWSVPATIFSEAGSDNIQALGDILPPATPASGGATVRSGETVSLSKEAEQGNYQQETEEFGYPADLSGSGRGFGQGLATVLVPGAQLGGFRPASSAGKFDYMLAYGLYPPGSHVSFSQSHEAGKDYSQAVHYLKEHVTGGHGSGQQKKFF